MKKLTLLFCFIAISIAINTYAQAPEKFNYQGIARSSNGNPIGNQILGIKISILNGSATGAAEYTETHTVTTNAYGLYVIAIGGGTPHTGEMTDINWGNGNKFIRVEMDPDGGTNYVTLGNTELLSVPYALYAANSNMGNAGGDLTGAYPNPTIDSGKVTSFKIAQDAVTTSKIANGAITAAKLNTMSATTGQVLKYNGTVWAPATDNNTTTPTGTAGGDLTGSYPNPTIGAAKITTAKIADNAVIGTKIVNNAITTAKIANGSITAAKLNAMGATNGQVMKYNGTAWVPSSVGAVNGSGTANTIPKFSNANTLANSQIKDNGTSVGINIPSLSNSIKFQVKGADISNAIKATVGNSPSLSIITSASMYGESASGMGVVGVSQSHNGVYGICNGNLGGTVGVSMGTGYGIWGVANGTGVAGFFEGGDNGRGIIVTKGASGFGTTTPKGRLMVMQPATPVPAIDTFPAIYGYSSTYESSLKGGVSGSYNTTHFGVGVHGLGYQGTNFQYSSSVFGLGSQDVGVYGSAISAGVEGVSVSGVGVSGFNLSQSNAAVTGTGNTYGIYGYAKTFNSTMPPTRYGVYGYATGANTNYAGYFGGNVNVTGTLAKASGTFKIDHPKDPENKYLYHSFVESPDMMNIYNGNVTTDANGYATIQMPDYFDALNKDFRYQLTAIGTFAQTIVSKEISNNQFVIQTSEPNVKVSWQVTGVRHDKYADAHRVVAEVEKEPEYKGYYVHAKEWGYPEDKSIDFLTRPKDAPERSGIKTSLSDQEVIPKADDNNKSKELAGVIVE